MTEGAIRLTIGSALENTPEPPAHLKTHGRAWWVEMVGQYRFSAADLPILRMAAEQLDRAETARRRLRKDGQFITDRFGQVIEHPALAAEGKAGDRHERYTRRLNLDSRPVANELPRLKRAAYK